MYPNVLTGRKNVCIFEKKGSLNKHFLEHCMCQAHLPQAQTQETTNTESHQLCNVAEQQEK